MKTFALALGSGGARGLAHIAVIEALDDMGVKPVAIAGTSVGALIGAAYAAGMSGKDIRHHILAIAHNPRDTRRRLLAARAGKLSDLLSGAFSQATQMDAEKFCAQFLPEHRRRNRRSPTYSSPRLAGRLRERKRTSSSTAIPLGRSGSTL